MFIRTGDNWNSSRCAQQLRLLLLTSATGLVMISCFTPGHNVIWEENKSQYQKLRVKIKQLKISEVIIKFRSNIREGQNRCCKTSLEGENHQIKVGRRMGEGKMLTSVLLTCLSSSTIPVFSLRSKQTFGHQESHLQDKLPAVVLVVF